MNAPQPDPVQPETPPSNPAGGRRSLLVAGVALGGLALGGGVAWWLRSRGVPEKSADATGDPFWAMQWQTPDGSPLAMASFKGRPLLLNFWATWCAPCVEELPLLNEFYRQNRADGWQVLALAVDRPEPVRAFLRQMPLDFPVAMAATAGADLGRTLGNVAGGLPFSVVVGSQGLVLQRKLGKLKPADLEAWRRLK